MSKLILPGDSEFDFTLGTVPPPAPPGAVFIARAGSGILEPASPEEIREYLNGGEYDERMEEIDEDEEWEAGNESLLSKPFESGLILPQW